MRFLSQYPFAVFLMTTLSLVSLLCLPQDDIKVYPYEAALKMTGKKFRG